MARKVDEWIGKNDDTPPPPRVKLRIFERHGGHCVHCGRRIGGNLRPCYDHVKAIINGGENRESNIELLCTECHGRKTVSDVRIKSKNYRVKLKHVGIKTKKRLIPGSKGSGFRRRMDGSIWREDK